MKGGFGLLWPLGCVLDRCRGGGPDQAMKMSTVEPGWWLWYTLASGRQRRIVLVRRGPREQLEMRRHGQRVSAECRRGRKRSGGKGGWRGSKVAGSWSCGWIDGACVVLLLGWLSSAADPAEKDSPSTVRVPQRSIHPKARHQHYFFHRRVALVFFSSALQHLFAVCF